MTPTLQLLALASALALAGGAYAQVYKWVDEKGVVNYSSTPPPKGRPAVTLDEEKGRVTTVPSLEMRRDTGAAGGDPALRQRVEQLEREVAAQRQTAAQQEAAAAEAHRRWREQCLAERRVDCDDPYRGSLDSRYEFGYAYPPQVRPPASRPRPQWPPGTYRPTPYIARGAGGVVGPYYESPPGGLALGPGPYGIGAGLNPAPPGGVVLAPGPGGIGSAYYPVPESMAPMPPARPQPRAPELRR